MLEMSKIKVVIIDVDGVLTDGIYQISDNGQVIKTFYTRDFYAINKLISNDIIVGIVTESSDMVIDQKMAMFGYYSEKMILHRKTRNLSLFSPDIPIVNKKNLFLLTGVKDKKKSIEEIIVNNNLYGNNIKWDNIAYIGDAENDLECMKVAYFTACPIDAIQTIRSESNYICSYAGGKGCVWELANYILEKRGVESENIKSKC